MPGSQFPADVFGASGPIVADGFALACYASAAVSSQAMSREPRDPALAAMLRATVRVVNSAGEGSGVVVRSGKAAVVATAYHVVEGEAAHRIRWPGGFAEATMLNHDRPNDVAILTGPPQLEAFALAAANAESNAAIGDDVWATGFPLGWPHDEPILARGVVAGFGPLENWLNIDGTWGNSGGPICRVTPEGPVVVGIVLGRAGESSKDLDNYRAAIHVYAAKLDSDGADRIEAEREFFEKARHTVFDPTLVSADTQMKKAAEQLRETEKVLGFLDAHFRTGFLRFADADDLRNLLE